MYLLDQTHAVRHNLFHLVLVTCEEGSATHDSINGKQSEQHIEGAGRVACEHLMCSYGQDSELSAIRLKSVDGGKLHWGEE